MTTFQVTSIEDADYWWMHYEGGPQYDYVITDTDGTTYGLTRREWNFEPFIIDIETGRPIADGRDTQEWPAFYAHHWKKEELHEGIKKAWKPFVLPPYTLLDNMMRDRFGDTYNGEDIEFLDLYEEEKLYWKLGMSWA